jgi:two-component system, chemotaxis family, protein-glutamate methylesterase/glutaminase
MKASLSGRLKDFEASQIVSMLEYGRMTGTLSIASAGGKGRLRFVDGRLVEAQSDSEEGELAAYLLVSAQEGFFRFARDDGRGPTQTLRSNQSLILESARLLDESRNPHLAFHRAAPIPPDLALNGARKVFRALGGGSTVPALAEILDRPPLEVLYHLERLERLGAVTRALGAARQPAGKSCSDRIRVLVVDDSPLMQKVLTRLFQSDPGFEVVGIAANGAEALEKLPLLRPDLISLDLFMPVLDGPATLRRIMLTQPTPTVVVTSASTEALEVTFESILRLGAVDFVTKPSRSRGDLGEQTRLILNRARKAAHANLRGLRAVPPPVSSPRVRAGRVPCQGIVVAASGTGGGLAMMQLAGGLPADLPCAVIGLLPLPDEFLDAFAGFLRRTSPFGVEVARDGTVVTGGVVYVAGPDREFRLEARPEGPVLRLNAPGPTAASGGLMIDAAGIFGSRAAAIVLSGEGDEALVGLTAVRAAGGVTMAQLPETCVDPEQCEQAIAAGLIDRVVLPGQLAGGLSHLHLERSRFGGLLAPTQEVADSWSERNA